MSENIQLTVDVSRGNEALDALDKRIDAIVAKENEVIQTTEKASRISFNRVLGMARLGWTMTDQIMQAMGINIGPYWRMIIQSALSTVSILTPLLSATALTPGMEFQAAMGFAELGFAITAIVQAQLGQQQAAQQSAETGRALFTIGNFINSISFM